MWQVGSIRNRISYRCLSPCYETRWMCERTMSNLQKEAMLHALIRQSFIDLVSQRTLKFFQAAAKCYSTISVRFNSQIN